MIPQIVVRESRQSDEAILDSHRQSAEQESHQYRGTPRLISTVPTRSYIAVVGDTAMGSLSLVEANDNKAEIVHVYVEPDARDIGIGDSLLAYAMNELMERGTTYLAASAQPGDRSLKNLFERHGLVAQTILVGRSLNGPSTEERASQ